MFRWLCPLLFVSLLPAQTPATQIPPLVCISASGSSITYACNGPFTRPPSIGAATSINFTPDVTNTTSTPTLNLGLGAKPLKDAQGNDVLIGSLTANSVYVVAAQPGGAIIRVLSGPAIVPTTINLQQSSPLICYDANGAHTVNFTCSRNPPGAPLTRGSIVYFSFEGTTNGANATLDVESSGGAQISYSDGSPIPAGSLAGDGSGTTNYYLLTFDADNDIWIFANQLLSDNVAPAISACGVGASISGTDRSGIVTEGTIATGCTITWHVARAAAARCTVSNQAGLAFTFTTSTTSLVLTNVGALSSTKITYACPN